MFPKVSILIPTNEQYFEADVDTVNSMRVFCLIPGVICYLLRRHSLNSIVYPSMASVYKVLSYHSEGVSCNSTGFIH